jgi:hypothetical protein
VPTGGALTVNPDLRQILLAHILCRKERISIIPGSIGPRSYADYPQTIASFQDYSKHRSHNRCFPTGILDIDYDGTYMQLQNNHGGGAQSQSEEVDSNGAQLVPILHSQVAIL